MSITNNINILRKEIPNHVTLVAVSKTKPNSFIQEAYNTGQRVFGENKIQEMVSKYDSLPKDIEWHMIGHLQRNKIKYMAHFVSLIHGVDSFKTLKEVNKQAIKNNRIISCLLQVKIAVEDSKFGLSKSDLLEILNSKELKELKNIQINGLMGMASLSNDKQQVAKEFSELNSIFKECKLLNSDNIILKILSMGMSGDYHLAIENGSTMVRIGSTIFGNRT